MRCPYCSSSEMKVNDKRDTEQQSIRRRRECLSCHKRFTTYERVEQIPFTVIKRDGHREAFDVLKLRSGITKACEKRPVEPEMVEQMIDTVEAALRCREETVIPSTIIGELVMDQLREIDGVAYLRYASVCRQFADLDSFTQEIEAIAKQ